MSFFKKLLHRQNLVYHDRRPLWKYFLTLQDFEELQNTLRFAQPHTIDPRDAALYYAEWWKRKYNGGKPSKENIFNSLTGNVKIYFDSDSFYKVAKIGGQLLGVKWIRRQNTLRFKTLLLQGGLPLTHLNENQSHYYNFLSAVLREQPESIEDIIFNKALIDHLPSSSQNDIIYENCFEIVRAILNKESDYDEFFETSQVLQNITKRLKSEAKELPPRVRIARPKNYWLLNKRDGNLEIELNLGLVETYSKDGLEKILGIDIEHGEIQLFVNDKLICIFRKLFSGNYKTDWFNQESHAWNGVDEIPETYVIIDDERFEIPDFINLVPSLYEPSLWTEHVEGEWRLIKGQGSPNKKAAILMPIECSSSIDAEVVTFHDKSINWLEFEGEVSINFNNQTRTFISDVQSFDWTIISERPSWMLRSNMPVVRGKFHVHVYDSDDKKVSNDSYEVLVKARGIDKNWRNLKDILYLSEGCFDVKIIMNDIVAFDQVYNIRQLDLTKISSSINESVISFDNLNSLNVTIKENEILKVIQDDDQFTLSVDLNYSKLPSSLKTSISYYKQRRLHCQVSSPFEGLGLLDKNGNLVKEDESLSLKSLNGLRILSTLGSETILSMRNKLNPEVKISKLIKQSFQPVISFRDEIVNLFYLSDAMDYRNRVIIELREGQKKKSYEIAGFSHTLDVSHQLEGNIRLWESQDDLELFSLPMSGNVHINSEPLERVDDIYMLPNTGINKQWIVISSKKDGNQMMPRFVNSCEDFVAESNQTRIDRYAQSLLENSFESGIWQQMLDLFTICSKNGYDIPFSTFDQFRTLSKNAKIAAKAFVFIAMNQSDQNTFIQKDIPEMEKDLGICFHWIAKDVWQEVYFNIFNENQVPPEQWPLYLNLLNTYLQEIGFPKLFQFINGNSIKAEAIGHPQIIEMRQKLGQRVLDEIPTQCPDITQSYNIPIQEHRNCKLLITAPIAVAESIKNLPQCNIWGHSEEQKSIRRNIQYSLYIAPDFYKKTILYTLS